MTLIPPLHVGRGTRRGPLMIFPVWHEAPAGRAVRLADERSVTVRELSEPQVPYLQVTATGTGPVLLLVPVAAPGGGAGRALRADHGPLRLRGIGDGARLIHASVIDQQEAAA